MSAHLISDNGKSKDSISELERLKRQLQAEIGRRIETKELLRLIQFSIDNSPDGVLWIRPNGQIAYANTAKCAMLGISPKDIPSLHIWDILTGLSQENWPEKWKSFKKYGSVLLEANNITKQGTLLPIEATLKYLEFQGQEYMISLSRDISARKNSEHLLLEEKDRLTITLASIADAVISTDKNGIVIMLNHIAEKLIGVKSTEAINHPIEEVLDLWCKTHDSRTPDIVDKVLKRGEVNRCPNKMLLYTVDGQTIPVSASVSPIRGVNDTIAGMVVVLRDVSAEERLEGERLRTSKLESLGIMAGGIAHDLNNLLAIISGNLTLAHNLCSNESALIAHLNRISQATDRARDLSVRLVTFAKGGRPLKCISSLRTIIEDSVKLAMTGSKHKCQCNIIDSLWLTEIDTTQMTQVFNNILINAAQSMDEGGKIEVNASNEMLASQDILRLGLPLESGPYVRVVIADHGIGIEPEILHKIFDPFFTTKTGSTGLGLSSAYSIVKGHRGHIGVHSEPHVGSVFSIYLPAKPEVKHPHDAEKEENTKFSIRILVMDDEELLIDMMTSLLSALGHKVESALNGDEAIMKYKKAVNSGTPFDLVILDLTIPGELGGKEILTELKKLNPQVKAVASSGYCIDPVMADYEHFGFAARLPKPFCMEDLKEVLSCISHK